MARYIYRAQYTYKDGSVSYERVVVEAASEAAALADVDAATDRYPKLIGATKTLVLLQTV